MINKVLIANRGAIAVRICRTLAAAGVRSLAIYAEDDRQSLHLGCADETVSLGSGPLTETYLNVDKIIDIARQHGVDAIHPGYGFLSENPDFVERCEAAGLIFLGPTAEQMRMFGLKHRARQIAEETGVPLLPGSGIVRDLEHALEEAERIGYPVMLKSTAGGGGIGMSLCFSQAELEKAFARTQRLSENNFSSSDLFLEKFVRKARHIEVQIFADGSGGAIALGERDCSAQRRHQKVVEEAPAANLDQSVREKIHQVAVELMQAVRYRSAGTVEFIYDVETEEFYFLEVNTRLQVEHGVTEEIFNVDLVQWMLQLGRGDLPDIDSLRNSLTLSGHAIQVRLYAENPSKDFQPSSGLLTQVEFPQRDYLRLDHWIEAGIQVSPAYDPMLGKIIVKGETRAQAIQRMQEVLGQTQIYGFETNLGYLYKLMFDPVFTAGETTTAYLGNLSFSAPLVEVLDAGTQTTIQDYPGRGGYWQVGIPPSGPFDDYSFRLGNRLLGNPEGAAGLEITLRGPTLQFHRETEILIAGAQIEATLDEKPVELWQPVRVRRGQTLRIGALRKAGCRSYLLVDGGLQCPEYLGSRSTFTLGQFGGHCGRALLPGDFLHLPESLPAKTQSAKLDSGQLPNIDHEWSIRVVPGPQGAPDFFTKQDIEEIFSATWKVHFNSSRTGIRLIGPKPEWARKDGGEAGLHPSNIHDNAYALGSIDFTGDIPVILGPDGPSLGGFVCPATVITADRWKLGQLKAGDSIRFVPVSQKVARAIEIQQDQLIGGSATAPLPVTSSMESPVLYSSEQHPVGMTCRIAGEKTLLVEYGEQTLDIALRCRVQALYEALRESDHPAIDEMTPGIRSLQIRYRDRLCDQQQMLELVLQADRSLGDLADFECPSRIIHLPISWDDPVCRLAAEKYMQTVRKDAPWCPSNIEFIRRINGLETIEDVMQIIFAATYLVLGLGDVYLGAPVATPVNPKHRLVTTKYNPARTWTAENSVGIGGSYMCIYGMEGPGGYQLFGRTLQMWNRYRKTEAFEEPWLLRFFDQIRFYPVSPEELEDIRYRFPRGEFVPEIEPGRFSLREYKALLQAEAGEIDRFTACRRQAFDAELQDWKETGRLDFKMEDAPDKTADSEIPDGMQALYSSVAGCVWKLTGETGSTIESGEPLLIVESMKMEIEVAASFPGRIENLLVQPGQQIQPGQMLALLTPKSEDLSK